MIIDQSQSSLDDAELTTALRSIGQDVKARLLLPNDPPLRDGSEEGVVTLTNRAERRFGADATLQAHEHAPTGTVRIASCFVRDAAGDPYLIEVSENLGDLDSTMQSLELVIVTVAPLVLLLSVGVGAFIMIRALKPLRAVVRWARVLDVSRLESQLEVTEGFDETLVLVDAFNQMTDRMAGSFRRVEEFAANASHELRTPLTSLTSSFEVTLKRERAGSEYKEVLDRALPEVRRLNRIVENLLVMAQVDGGDVVLRTNSVELDGILLESYEAIHLGGLAGGITVELGDMDVGIIEGDQHWLRQLFDNLLSNAVKYSRENGNVTVSAYSEESSVRVVIEDDGIGIPEEERAQIFSRYYRVQTKATQMVTGVGLGLSIALWAAEAHGGRIEVEAAHPQGTRFVVTLPTEQSERIPKLAKKA
ncbi:MAG: two-component system heavy metal sensor histidine kinase CusS [Planctomycetota bacterium]|jgi:two-component system heavy metal sensor histidine kinase CusS